MGTSQSHELDCLGDVSETAQTPSGRGEPAPGQLMEVPVRRLYGRAGFLTSPILRSVSIIIDSFVRLWRSPLEMCGHGLEAIHSCFRAFTLINSRWRSSVQGHEDHGTGGVEALRLGEAALAAWRRLGVRHHEAVALARIAELRSHHG